MRLLDLLPRAAVVVALLVWAATLYLLIASGATLTQPLNLLFIIALAVACQLIVLAQNPNRENAGALLWASGGLWSAAAYRDFQLVGFLYLIVAALTLGSAWVVERERRAFSLGGPAAFVAAAVGLILLANVLGAR